MRFEEALKEMRAGGKVRRKFFGKGQFVRLCPTGNVFVDNMNDIANQFSSSFLIADDWEAYVEAPQEVILGPVALDGYKLTSGYCMRTNLSVFLNMGRDRIEIDNADPKVAGALWCTRGEDYELVMRKKK